MFLFLLDQWSDHSALLRPVQEAAVRIYHVPERHDWAHWQVFSAGNVYLGFLDRKKGKGSIAYIEKRKERNKKTFWLCFVLYDKLV